MKITIIGIADRGNGMTQITGKAVAEKGVLNSGMLNINVPAAEAAKFTYNQTYEISFTPVVAAPVQAPASFN